MVFALLFSFSSCKRDIKKVEISPAIMSLEIGKTAQLSAIVTPLDAEFTSLTWKSSDNAIATVDGNGKVTAIAKGTAMITAKVGGKTGTCTVTIYATSPTTYKIGDLYNKDGVRGIVFKITDGGKHGYILSINRVATTVCPWSKVAEITGATDVNSGQNNMNKIKTISNWTTNYPVFKYWDDLGWYIPAWRELMEIFHNNTDISFSLIQNGGNELDGIFLSSTEESRLNAYGIRYIASEYTIEYLWYPKDIPNETTYTFGIRKF